MQGIILQDIVVGDVQYRIHTSESTNADNPTIVFLHGFLGSGEVYYPLIPLLTDDINIVLIDLPGHGSTQFPNDARRYHLQHQIKDLGEIIQKYCPSKPYLYGYSMGGRLAVRYALYASKSLKGLILESTSPGIQGLGSLRDRLLIDQDRAKQVLRNYPAFLQEWNNSLMFKGGNPDIDAYQAYIDIQLQQKPEGLANSLTGFSAALMPNVRTQLMTLTIPVQLIAGAYDVAYTAQARQMYKLIPNSEFIVISEAAHRVHLDTPDQISDIINKFILTHT